jgi:hypothetical protein
MTPVGDGQDQSVRVLCEQIDEDSHRAPQAALSSKERKVSAHLPKIVGAATAY